MPKGGGEGEGCQNISKDRIRSKVLDTMAGVKKIIIFCKDIVYF